jgi:hypothetical protein
MSQAVKRSSGWLVALLVAVALLFGARALLASPANLSCPNPPYNGGTCEDLEECEGNCEMIFGDYDHAACGINGCCRCFL